MGDTVDNFLFGPHFSGGQFTGWRFAIHCGTPAKWKESPDLTTTGDRDSVVAAAKQGAVAFASCMTQLLPAWWSTLTDPEKAGCRGAAANY